MAALCVERTTDFRVPPPHTHTSRDRPGALTPRPAAPAPGQRANLSRQTGVSSGLSPEGRALVSPSSSEGGDSRGRFNI